MLEKISTDFVGKIYSALTYGSGDINFLCSCIRMQNHEEATNKPVNFALKLLKINIMCRIPFLKGRMLSKSLGSDYLSEAFLRPPVVELATGVLDNESIITDIFGSAIVVMKSKRELFELLEEKNGVKGFAEARSMLDDCGSPIESIYEALNEKLGCSVDCKAELEIFERCCLKNNYAVRLLDIANGNGLKVTAYVRTSYPKKFISNLLNKCGVFPDELLISSCDAMPVPEDAEYTGIVSSDFKRFIKGYIKKGCQPFYYPEPRSLMEKVKKPALSRPFAGIYDGICGVRILGGSRQYSREYELAYLCLAPAVFGFALSASRTAEGKRAVCVCGEYSLFADIISKLLPNAVFDADFIPESGGDDFVIYPHGKSESAQIDICGYLGISQEDADTLAAILLGPRKGSDGSVLNRAALKEMHCAVRDFSDDFIAYLNQSGAELSIDGSDCAALYRRGESGLREAIYYSC